MIKKAIEIARLHLITTFQHRSTLVFGFLLPLIATYVLGLATGNAFGGDDAPPTWRLALVNQDAGIFGAELAERLDADSTIELVEADLAEAALMVEENEVSAGLIVPAEFSQTLTDQNELNLELHVSPENSNEGVLIEQAVTAHGLQIAGILNAAQTSEQIADQLELFADDNDNALRTSYQANAQTLAETSWQSPPVGVRRQQATQDESQEDAIPVGLNQTAPAQLVIFSMFFMMGGVALLVQEREEGTLRRLVTMPISKGAILFGKLLGVFIAGMIQMGILVLVGHFVMGVSWGNSWLGLLIVLLAFAYCITALGTLFAALVRTVQQANSLPTLIILPMCALGGAMWPLEITPEWMQKMGHIFPVAWAMDGFNDIVTRGLSVADILPEAGVLTLYGIIFLAIGIWRFKFE